MDGSWSIKVNNHKYNHMAFQTATFIQNAMFLLEQINITNTWNTANHLVNAFIFTASPKNINT